MKPSLDGITYDVFAPWSELAEDGRDEDGTMMTKLLWTVVGESEDGYRVMSRAGFASEEVALRKAVIFNRCNNNGTLDFQLFFEIDPAYGSKAYVDRGIEYQRYLQEKAEDAFDRY